MIRTSFLFGLTLLLSCASDAVSREDLEKNRDPVKKKVTAKQVVASMDKNGDSKISKTEASDEIEPFFGQLDKNSDGVIDLEEAQSIANGLNIQEVTELDEAAPSSNVDEQKALALLVNALAKADDSGIQASLLYGMLAGLAGRRDVAPPPTWNKVAAQLARSSDADVRDLSAELSRIFGDEEATDRALETTQDKSAVLAKRRRALHSLLTQKNPQVSELLEQLLDEPDLRLDAIRGFAAIENARAPKILLNRYAKGTVPDRRAIIETLATRRQYAAALLEAIKKKQVPKADVPAHVARSLDLILGDAFGKVFGDVRKLSEDRAPLMAKYRKLITDEALSTADAVKGRVVFSKTCASCHKMYGEGAEIGPDLTGSNRGNLDYLLLNSVDPSYDVPDGYKVVVIVTVDGRVLNGVVAEEDGQRVILKTVEQPRGVVLKADIASRHVSEKSIMPDGQFEQMKPQELLDLVKYMQTVEQVELAK